MNKFRPTDVADVVPYSEQHDRERMPAANEFMIERHVPDLFDTPFHHHTSVEINFLEGCDMVYSFAGVPVKIMRDELTIFWGAQPHMVKDVIGKGWITNIYLSLGQFLRWGLPERLVKALQNGAVLSTGPNCTRDNAFFERLWEERHRKDTSWRRTHLDEIATRLRRFGLEGWTVRLDPANVGSVIESDARTMRHVEDILRFVADNFSAPITVGDVAEAVNLSASRATSVFREVMGVSIKHHLTRTRLSHARMLLTETDSKIVAIALDSGFQSLSSFYAAFTDANNVSPAEYRKAARGN